MKNEKEIQWAFSLGLIAAAITCVTVVSGCGRNIKHKTKSPQSQDSESTPQSPEIPDFASVQMQDLTPELPSGWQEIFQTLPQGIVVRAEEYYNPTENPVVLWINSSGELRTHTEYHPFHTELTDGVGSFSLEVSFVESGAKEIESVTGNWLPIQVEAKASVQFRWIATFASGHLSCAGAQNDSPGDTPSFFQMQGSLHREIRVSAVGTELSQVAEDVSLLDVSQVDVLQVGDFPIAVSNGASPDDVFRYACVW